MVNVLAILLVYQKVIFFVLLLMSGWLQSVFCM